MIAYLCCAVCEQCCGNGGAILIELLKDHISSRTEAEPLTTTIGLALASFNQPFFMQFTDSAGDLRLVSATEFHQCRGGALRGASDKGQYPELPKGEIAV